MKTFTFKNNLLKFMLLMITAFTTGNSFAQTVTFTAPIPETTIIYAGGSVPFAATRSSTASFEDGGTAASGNFSWLWSASPAAGVTIPGTNPESIGTGTTSSSKTISFANAGTYTITLTVSRLNGASVQATKTVIVLAGPTATAPGNPTASPVTCSDDGTVLGSNPCSSDAFSARFINGDFVEGSAASGTSVGAIWRFPNITNDPTPSNQTNAQITVEFIYQAQLAELDDDDAIDEDGNSTTETEGWFAPRIDPDQDLSTDRRGFVQFKIEFFQESALTNLDYVVAKALLGINYSHRDIDGTRTANYYFRETGLLKNPTGAVLATNANTELTSYAYNDGDDWEGVAGSVCNRSNVSRYAEVAASFIYGPGTGKTSLTFRMGYDFDRLSGGSTNLYDDSDNDPRLYATEFKCFNFPEINLTTLPVKYSFFNAKREGNDVKLAWQTATEDKNLGFQIERRIANGEWQEIGFSAAKSFHGNSATPIDYTYIDANNTAKGVIQYRLKQLDFDNRFAYSDVRAVRGVGVKGGLLIYPNPSIDGKVNIVFEDNNSAVDVSLSDMNGRTIKQWRKVTSSALQINSLTPGMYLLRIVNNQSGEQTVEKIMVNNR